MSTTTILNDLLRDTLPPTRMNPKRLFGSLSIRKRPLPHRLPNELLSYIFLIATHCLEDRYEAILTPITISHVCSHWREVALSTGGLWTNLILTFPTSRGQLSRTVTWLTRSQTYPIDIFLDFRDPSWDWEENSHTFHWHDMEAILRLFLTHVKRWSHFELLTDTWAPIFTFLWYTCRVESAPLLQSISLSRCNAYLAGKGATFQPVELKAPIPLFGGRALDGLRDVSFVGVHVDWARSSLRNLTRLEFRYHASDVMPSLDQFVDILAACSSLRHLSIIGWGPQFYKTSTRGTTSEGEGYLEGPQKVVQLRHLTSFSFGFIDVTYAVKVLSLFSFPSLESLTLEDVLSSLSPLENQDATPILNLLASSYGSGDYDFSLNRILSLQLHGLHSTESTFSHFFSSLPRLRRLGLFGTPSYVLRALAPLHPPLDTGLRSRPCPFLEDIECRNVDPIYLVDLVRIRRETKSVSSLDNITFDSGDDASPEDRLKLTEAGIQVLSGPIKLS
jgi:hypothetical protein